MFVDSPSDRFGVTHQEEGLQQITSGGNPTAQQYSQEQNGATDQQLPAPTEASLFSNSAASLSRSEGRSPYGILSRTYTTPPSEVARVIESLSTTHTFAPLRTAAPPTLSLALWPLDGALGVRLFLDSVTATPDSVSEAILSTDRALDAMLIQLLTERGRWLEESKSWIVTSSSDMRIILGLAGEYEGLAHGLSEEPLSLARDSIDASLICHWSELGLELSMEWRRSGDRIQTPTPAAAGSVIGSDPYWVFIESALLPVSPQSAPIIRLFSHGPTVWLPRYQVGPVLEALSQSSPLIQVRGAEHKPTSQICQPRSVLTVTLRSAGSEHFFSNDQLELSATLEFDYPTPPSEQNIVFLPDRPFEEKASEILIGSGFQQKGEGRKFSLHGDDVLDFLHSSEKQIPDDWVINGINEARAQMRFSDLSISISLTASSEGSATGAIAETTPSNNWFDCQVKLLQNNADVPLSSLFKRPMAEDARWVRLDSGAFAPIPTGSLAQLKSVLGIVDPNFKLSGGLKTKLSAAQALSLSSSPGPFCSLLLDDRIVTMRRHLLSAEGIPAATPHKNFKGKLRSYQAEGVGWVSFLNECALAGILADEMGLGKTVQTLAFLQNLHLNASRPIAPSLIIAPTSVTTNWLYEARRFTPDLRVLILQGPHRKRLFSSIPSYDLVITSYALLRLDRHELSHYQFSALVLDEAQNIKNHSAATTKAAKALKAHSRLALSGTPTENRPLELWSIMDFLMPGYLGTAEFFRNNIEKPILEEGPSGKIGELLRAKVRPFILRRTKAEVEKDLPPKIESVLHVEMTHSQRDLYTQILEEVKPKVFDAIEKRGVSGATVSILTALLRLRQVCNHPNSIGALKSIEGFDSGKFNLFKELVLEALESNRKILVFSQFKEMLSIMQSWIDELTIPYLYLDGSTKDRQSLVDTFNTDPSIRLFLISLKAGGTGLNLTAADTVIIYDPWWNPAVESQAVDRAHRIGQVKTVNVYRLVTEHSVEQRIMDLKRKKAHLVDALVNENGTSPLTLTSRELELLFESPLYDIGADNKSAIEVSGEA